MSETTHDKILGVAAKIFAEKGYSGTCMREIAEELDITKAALYYHFPGKEEIFNACLTHTIGKIVAGLEELAETEQSIWDKLRMLINGMCNFSTDNPHIFNLFKKVASQSFDKTVNMGMLQDYFTRQLAAVQKIVEQGIENGELRDDIPVNLLTAALSGMIHHTTGPKMRLMAGIDISHEEQVDILLKLIQEGFKK